MTIRPEAFSLSREAADKFLVDVRIRLENITSMPNFWKESDPDIQGSDLMILLQECRRLYLSSLHAYTVLSSEARCRQVDRMGEAMGQQILTTLVSAHLECEEEKAKHRVAGDENLEAIRNILEDRCSSGLLKSECQKLFSFVDKVLSNWTVIEFVVFSRFTFLGQLRLH